jgi:hypothetical protein
VASSNEIEQILINESRFNEPLNHSVWKLLKWLLQHFSRSLSFILPRIKALWGEIRPMLVERLQHLRTPTPMFQQLARGLAKVDWSGRRAVEAAKACFGYWVVNAATKIRGRA